MDSEATWCPPNGNNENSSHTTNPPLHDALPTYQAKYDIPSALPPLPDEYVEDALYLDDPNTLQDAQDSESLLDPATTRTELLGQIGQYLSLVLAPLFFGGLTCLFVLPLVANDRAKLPPAGLWPITLVIIAIAIAQGIAVYYSGTNNVAWAASTLGAFFLFLLVGCFAIFGALPSFSLLVFFLILSLILARLYIHFVPEGTVEVAYLFGKYSRTLYPGLNLLFPGEKRQKPLNTKETEWVCPIQRVQMSRTEDVVLRATVSYQLMPEDAHLALTQVKNWEESLHELFIASLQDVATTFTPEDLLIWQRGLRPNSNAFDNSFDSGVRWEQINNQIFQSIRDKVALWGVQINGVRVRDVALTPHGATTADTNDPLLKTTTTDARTAGAATTQPGQNAQANKTRPDTNSSQPAQLPAIKDEDLDKVLSKLYKEVQGGRITDPDNIRRFANQFEAVANDPQKSALVSFDAARAARNLHAEAERYAQSYAANSPYNDTTKTDWNIRRPKDENMMAGG
jgi:regulator of protease activity HflC (stomatin/prohibitin superfamily)